MNITDMLAQAGGLQSVARDLGISESQAASGAEALLPAILGGLKKQAQTSSGGLDSLGGLGGLGGLLGQLGGGGLLDQVLSPQQTDPAPGNDVLGQIFGSKDVSRTVAQDAAARSGLDSGLLRKMLPLLAMVVTGFMAKKMGDARRAPDPAEQASGNVGGLGGLGGLGAMLDRNGDGNALDDILRMAGRRTS
ncbi:MAG: DUF937 domain-containing protein [Pseudomonadota bacterium]